MSCPTALYRLYDAEGVLLYIGISRDPRIRWYQHAGSKQWWPEVERREVVWHETAEAAVYAERTAIREEMPRYNISGVPRHLVPPKR